ncbi:uncharacterized protein LOC129767976 [Toxorhynchites rutilus septentrionalis]|uniref:uncharacterized protein LOC129767976 n=1 Tax=Toxorhynchites rutilus septentrionalis TaxID=329112 RepID=UPI0024790A54|nr:uncharacterized protein LOC129767976 [Toxorhynchites rutilus septentrionalis]
MEIRWCWTAIILTVVSHMAMTHKVTVSSPSSSSSSNSNTSHSSSSNDSTNPVNITNIFDNQSTKPAKHVKEDSEPYYNLDEPNVNSEAFAAKSVKKYLQKENKKYKKKNVPSGNDRQTQHQQSEPINREHKESKGEEDDSSTHKSANESEKPHSRKKRLIWVTDDGRLALPPGTSLTIAPTIALPFVRYPPTGFLSNISISLPITIDFDKLGLTDNQNPLGVLPPLFARSMGRAAGSVLADYVSDFMHTRRRKRSATNFRGSDNFKITTNIIDDEDDDRKPELPEEHKHSFHGGERALLYTVVEDFISNFGLDGKACMLRAICEVHSKRVESFGLIGEMLKLFFTASMSPYSEFIPEYVSAENIGKGKAGPGECFPYYKDCPKSLFRMANKFQQNYKPESSNESVEEQLHENSIDDIERDALSAKMGESSVEAKEETVIQLDGVNKIAM